MGHEDAPLAAEHAAEGPLEDLPPHARIERREWVVDDVCVHVVAVGEAREAEACALPAGERDAALAHLGEVALRQLREVGIEARGAQHRLVTRLSVVQ